MADENRDQQNEDQPQEDSTQAQPVDSGTAAENADDVQAYGEPSDGSGGTVKGG